MALEVPKYIVEAQVQDNILRYEWDDWQLEKVYEPIDEVLYRQMDEISYRANMAFTIASGEWVVYRFGSVSDDQVPLDHIEATWAGIVDGLYFIYWEPPDENWMGPIRGPLSLAIIFTIEAGLQAADENHPALSSARISKLVEHVLKDPTAYRTWRNRVVERLRVLYPFDEEDPSGDVVPREALDADFDFRPEMTQDLINRFLSKLNWRVNHFLRSPEDLIKQGFQGTPYRFDIREDRRNRLDWWSRSRILDNQDS